MSSVISEDFTALQDWVQGKTLTAAEQAAISTSKPYLIMGLLLVLFLALRK